MRKVLATALLISLFGFGTALADILPEGQKSVPVCAYFNNTADFADTLSVYGYETGPDGEQLDLYQVEDDECYHSNYKFDTLSFHAVTADYAAELDMENWDPRADENVMPLSEDLQIGNMMVDETDTLESVTNEYAVVGMDEENNILNIEAVSTTKYFNDGSDAEVTEGEVTVVNQEEEVTEEETTEEDVPAEETEEDVVAEDLFTDVTTENEYYDALKYLKDEGIIEGYPDGSYKPDTTINRAEFTKIVVGSAADTADIDGCLQTHLDTAENNQAWDGVITLFNDVAYDSNNQTEPDWYFSFVCEAKKMDVIEGYPDGSFKPAQEINFVEAAKIITVAMGGELSTSEPWYMDYVTELADKNAIPTSIDSFDKMITRGEMAEIMYRLRAEVTDLESLTYDDLN